MGWGHSLMLLGTVAGATWLGREITLREFRWWQAPLSLVSVGAGMVLLLISQPPAKPCPVTVTPVTTIDAVNP